MEDMENRLYRQANPAKIRQARENVGLTIRALAECAGIPLKTYDDIEKGRVTPAHHQITAIEDALSLPPGTFDDCAPLYAYNSRKLCRK